MNPQLSEVSIAAGIDNTLLYNALNDRDLKKFEDSGMIHAVRTRACDIIVQHSIITILQLLCGILGFGLGVKAFTITPQCQRLDFFASIIVRELYP